MIREGYKPSSMTRELVPVADTSTAYHVPSSVSIGFLRVIRHGMCSELTAESMLGLSSALHTVWLADW